MALKQVIEAYELFDSASILGPVVEKFLKETVKRIVGKPVTLPRSLIAKAICELTSWV